MSKAEILADLKAKNIFDVSGSRDPTWRAAFEEYRKETRIKLCNCSGSYTKLRNWLKS